MNLSEGTRRLALVLGGLGAIAGGVLSYVYLQPILNQRDLHNEFERLADSDVVKGERKTLQRPTPPATLPPDFNGWDKPVSTATPQPSSQTTYRDDNGNPIVAKPSPIPPPPSGYAVDPKTGWRVVGLPPGAVLKPTGRPQLDPKTGEPIQSSRPALDPSTGEPIDPFAAIATPLPSEVNKGGIATINWSHDYGVASIEITNGETLSPTPAPARWQYLLGALLPVLGFLVPWGAIRAIGWVVTGFVQPAK